MFEIYEAILCGDLNHIKTLINKGFNINETNQFGETPLFRACNLGNIQIVKLLIGNGASIHAKNYQGRGALHCASSTGKIKIMKLLLSKGAEINAVDDMGITPLAIACFGHSFMTRGNLEAIKLLIKKGADVNAADNYQRTPLQRVYENADGAKLLIPRMLLQEPAQEKPSYLEENQELSAYWDEQLEKINYLPQVEIIGSKTLTKTILTKVSSGKNDSLVYYSFNLLFKSLNPEIIKNKIYHIDKQLDTTPPKLGG